MARLEMGGMFSSLKCASASTADELRRSRWYENPPGTEAYECTGELPDFAQNPHPKHKSRPKPTSKAEGLLEHYEKSQSPKTTTGKNP